MLCALPRITMDASVVPSVATTVRNQFYDARENVVRSTLKSFNSNTVLKACTKYRPERVFDVAFRYGSSRIARALTNISVLPCLSSCDRSSVSTPSLNRSELASTTLSFDLNASCEYQLLDMTGFTEVERIHLLCALSIIDRFLCPFSMSFMSATYDRVSSFSVFRNLQEYKWINGYAKTKQWGKKPRSRSSTYSSLDDFIEMHDCDESNITELLEEIIANAQSIFGNKPLPVINAVHTANTCASVGDARKLLSRVMRKQSRFSSALMLLRNALNCLPHATAIHSYLQTHFPVDDYDGIGPFELGYLVCVNEIEYHKFNDSLSYCYQAGESPAIRFPITCLADVVRIRETVSLILSGMTLIQQFTDLANKELT